MKEPTSSLHKSSRQMSTPPPITPHRWENMTIGLTRPLHPAEPTTPAETLVPPLNYVAMAMGNTDSLELFFLTMCSTHAFLAPDEHRCSSGSFCTTPHAPAMEDMSMSYKSQLLVFQMVFLPWECVQLCSYTDVNYLKLDLCETRDIYNL